MSSNNLPSEKIKGYFERIVRDCLKVLRRIEGIEKKRFVESDVIEAIGKKYKPILRKNNIDENNSSNSV